MGLPLGDRYATLRIPRVTIVWGPKGWKEDPVEWVGKRQKVWQMLHICGAWSRMCHAWALGIRSSSWQVQPVCVGSISYHCYYCSLSDWWCSCRGRYRGASCRLQNEGIGRSHNWLQIPGLGHRSWRRSWGSWRLWLGWCSSTAISMWSSDLGEMKGLRSSN